MNLLHSLLFAYQVLVLWYFALLNLLYALFALFGIRMVARYARELSELALKDLLEREAYLPVSILVPTYNEEKTIAASVRSFLALHYPEFEVIVVADGPKDRTLEVLKEAFHLVPVEAAFRRVVPTQPIRGGLSLPPLPQPPGGGQGERGQGRRPKRRAQPGPLPPLLRRGRRQPPGRPGPPPGEPALPGGRPGAGRGGDHKAPERGRGAGGDGGGPAPSRGLPGADAGH